MEQFAAIVTHLSALKPDCINFDTKLCVKLMDELTGVAVGSKNYADEKRQAQTQAPPK